MENRMLWCVLLTVPLIGGTVTAQTKLPTNPIIWADVPDNALIRVGENYYMSSTTMHMNPGLPIMKSRDLINWEMLNYAYEKLCDNDEMNLRNGKDCYGLGSWASSLRYHDGTFYVTTFSSTTDKTHVYTTNDIEKGDWKSMEFAPLIYDHSLFFDDDGRTYMIYGQGTIKIIELKPDVSGIKEGGVNQVLIDNASAPVGGEPGRPAEGSQMFKKDGKYYLFNITWTPGDEMRTEVVHRADKITGPYEGKVFLKDRGIAQGGLIDTPEGRWFAYMFRDFGAVGRIPYLMPVKWENGWPVVANDEGKVPDYLDISASKRDLSKVIASDEFNYNHNPAGKKLALMWQWNHNPVDSLWSLTEREGFLRLKTGRIDDNVCKARNTLTQRTFGPVCSGYVALETGNMKDGDIAGLIALEKEYGFVGVRQEGNRQYVVMTGNNNDKRVEWSKVPLRQKRIYLRIDCDFMPVNENRRKDKARFYYSLDGRRWVRIGKDLNMVYSFPSHFMGYRFGLFNMATKTIGGYADFDYFRIKDSIEN